MTKPSEGAAQRAQDKIRNVLGQAQADTLIAEAMRAAGLVSIEAPNDRYRFGVELTKRSGLCEAIGRAIMVQALLHGAKAA